MKRFFGVIFIILCLVLGLTAINNETDFFENIGLYIPYIGENYPETAEKLSDISNDISAITHQIPSFSELKAMITGKELPIDPTDVAINAYIKDSPMLNFNPTENISIEVYDNKIEVFGIVSSYNRSNLVVCINSEDGETLEQTAVPTDSDYQFDEVTEIPETSYDTLDVAVYTGSRPYGNFISWVYNYVTLDRDYYGDWKIKTSPVYDNNVAMYERDKSVSDALKSTLSIQSEYNNIKKLAAELTEGIDSDYNKARALHDWVCSYLYYDNDSLLSDEVIPYSAVEVINSQRAVCLGYATLYAALCRAEGIPCNVVSGYALGIGSDSDSWNDCNISTGEQNHAWNEVYVDGRWVIVDTTWDSPNKIENGEYIKGDDISYLYFDANLQFFSANHKILEYTLRR